MSDIKQLKGSLDLAKMNYSAFGDEASKKALDEAQQAYNAALEAADTATDGGEPKIDDLKQPVLPTDDTGTSQQSQTAKAPTADSGEGRTSATQPATGDTPDNVDGSPRGGNTDQQKQAESGTEAQKKSEQ